MLRMENLQRVQTRYQQVSRYDFQRTRIISLNYFTRYKCYHK